MMASPLPRPLILTAALIAFCASRAGADGLRVVETVYGSPAIVTVPTSYSLAAPSVYTSSAVTLIPTYYVSPAAYVAPTYTTTRYVLPRRFWRRPLVATSYSYDLLPTSSYLATSYYLPASYSLPVVASSALCCDPTPACVESPAIVQPIRPSNGSNPDATAGAEGPTLNPNLLRSTPRKPSNPPAAGEGAASTGTSDELETPPKPAPEGNDNAGNVPGAEAARRDAMRPAFGNARARGVSIARSVLGGRVLSAVSGLADKDVMVTASDARGRFRDRNVTTDANGRFAMILPEGDWTVSVLKPDGKGRVDYEVTVAGGIITDTTGQEITALSINR
jgi:hypothetical protein